jgi:hypothetical protein
MYQQKCKGIICMCDLATVQMVSHQPVATEAWVRSQGSPYGISGDVVELRQVFSVYSILTLSVSFH